MTRVINKLKLQNRENKRNIWSSWLVSISQLISCNTIQDLKRQNMGNQNSKVRFPQETCYESRILFFPSNAQKEQCVILLKKKGLQYPDVQYHIHTPGIFHHQQAFSNGLTKVASFILIYSRFLVDFLIHNHQCGIYS